MNWDLEEQKMRARFSELRSADRRLARPGFEEVCRGRPVRWGMLGVAAGLVVVAASGVLLSVQGGKQPAAEWPDIEIVMPEVTNESPTAPLLTYVDDMPGTWPGDRGFN